MSNTHGGLFDLDVKIDNASLPAPYEGAVVSFEVERTYNRPDLCVIRLKAPDQSDSEDLPPALTPGSALVVRSTGDAGQKFFEGEIAAIELDGAGQHVELVLRAYDKRHRLYRQAITKAYPEMSAAGIVQAIAGDAHLDVTVPGGSATAPFQLQTPMSGGEYFEQLAHELGWVSLWEEGRWIVKALKDCTDELGELKYGENLFTFNCRASADGWADAVTVRDWDPSVREVVIGTASDPDGARPNGSATAPSGERLGSKGVLEVRHTIDPTHATDVATAKQQALRVGGLQLDGTCDGHTALKVGGVLTLKGVGKRFAGKYRVSWLRHTWTNTSDLVTEFSCNDHSEQNIASVIRSAADGAPSPRDVGHRIFGVAPAIVTNISDDENQGRVKVRYPWLSDDIESHWVRIAAPGAGHERGWFVLPEVEDEVLVAFEHGDPNRGYVLGGLYNGVDKPPPTENSLLDPEGKLSVRLFKTRRGHQLVFEDNETTSGMSLQSSDEQFELKFEEGTGNVTLQTAKSGSKVVISAAGDVTIESGTGNVSISAGPGNLELKATNITLDATAGLNLKGGATAKMEAPSAEVSGSATAKLGGSITEISGGLVKIN